MSKSRDAVVINSTLELDEKQLGIRSTHEYDGSQSLSVYMHEAQISRLREANSKGTSKSESPIENHRPYDDDDLIQARRALRTASWWAVFYLITTDILGPFNAPFAFSQVGYVPGAILYLFMGAVACYTGLILWKLFCALDSDKYPIKTYAELGGRILGKWFAHLCSVLQTIQLIIIVGTACLTNAQSVEQIARDNKICFSVSILIWILVGMFIGQVRTLKQYGWFANSAVWLNLTLIFVTMGFVAHSPPNFESAKAAFGIDPGPVVTQTFGSGPLFAKVNGIMNMVFAYGGAMIFPEFMAEMKRPMDFWKAMCYAQLLIVTNYMLYGIFVYSFQGQFTIAPSYQGVSKFSWQTVGNVIGLFVGIIAAGLYGNIGIKIAYYHIIEEWMKGPHLMSKKGRLIWTGMVILYWALAFIVASAIPQVQTISGLVGAVCVVQFTYTFPPLLIVGFYMRIDATHEDPGDSWTSLSRWRRSLFTGKWHYKVFNILLFLAALSMACLGMYGSGKAVQATFQSGGAATSFGCGSPV